MSHPSKKSATGHDNNATALVAVPFHGGHLYAAGGEYANPGDRPVPLRPACDRLGIDIRSQLRKLHGTSWATVVMMTMVAEDGKEREMACLPLRALPMWLASINPSKVVPELRNTLEAYQREAADVLYRHFMPEAAANDVSQLAAVVAKAIAPMVDKIGALQTQVREQAVTIVDLQYRLAGNGTIGDARARRHILNPLNAMVRHIGDPDQRRGERGSLDAELRSNLVYFGAFEMMPEAMLPLAHRWVSVIRRRQERRYRKTTGPIKTRPGQMELKLVPDTKKPKKSGTD